MENYLSGADVAMVVVTVVLVQLLKFVLPSPPADITKPVKRWSVAERLRWAPFFSAFIIGITLSLIFDPHEGQKLLGKIRDGLQTGAYAVVMWETYRHTVGRIIEQIRGS